MWSVHLHAPDALTRVLIEQTVWWAPSQSKRCGGRISNSACSTRSSVTTSAEQQKLIIKWQENEPGNLTSLLAVPYQAFLFMEWTMKYVYHTTWKQKRAFPSFTFDCDMWWNLLHRNQTTTDREWNMLCGIWHRLGITEGFQLQSIPQMFTSCNITFQILGSQFSYYKSKSLLTKKMRPNEIPCMASPLIRPINRNISAHFLVQIIQSDGVKIVAGRLLCRITSSASHFRQPFHEVNSPSICEVVGHACT